MDKLFSGKTFIATRIFLVLGTFSLITDLWLYGSESYFQFTHEGLFSLALGLLFILFTFSNSLKESKSKRKTIRQINLAESVLSAILSSIFVFAIVSGILEGKFQLFKINTISFWIFILAKIVSIFIVTFEGATNPRIKNICGFALLAFFYSYVASFNFFFSINLTHWLSIVILMGVPLTVLFLNIHKIRNLVEEFLLTQKTVTLLSKELTDMFDVNYRNKVLLRDFVINPREGNTPSYAVSINIGENELEEVENILSNTKQFLKNKGIQNVVIESYLSDKEHGKSN